MEKAFSPVKYGVGIDMGKDEFYACVSAIDQTQRIKVKATHSFKNEPKGLADFYRWADHHCKDNSLSVHFLMEATGVYYEQLALFLHQKQAYVCVILPQKANRTAEAALHSGTWSENEDRWGGCSGPGYNDLPTTTCSLATHQRSYVQTASIHPSTA